MVSMTDLIECKPGVMLGKPVIRGTRITVQLVLEALAAGETLDQLLDSYPNVTREGLLAALAYAAQTLATQSGPDLVPSR
jgi:uncharacterized protein (DUF433 family)